MLPSTRDRDHEVTDDEISHLLVLSDSHFLSLSVFSSRGDLKEAGWHHDEVPMV